MGEIAPDDWVVVRLKTGQHELLPALVHSWPNGKRLSPFVEPVQFGALDETVNAPAWRGRQEPHDGNCLVVTGTRSDELVVAVLLPKDSDGSTRVATIEETPERGAWTFKVRAEFSNVPSVAEGRRQPRARAVAAETAATPDAAFRVLLVEMRKRGWTGAFRWEDLRGVRP